MLFSWENASSDTHAIDLGMQLVGMVVMICCQTRVPMPRKMHQTHCSTFRAVVEKAMPPNWTMIIYGGDWTLLFQSSLTQLTTCYRT